MNSAAKIAAAPIRSPYYPETAENILAGYEPDAGAPAWLAALRVRAHRYISDCGLPTPKLEGWKYTNIIPQVRGYGMARRAAKIIAAPLPGLAVRDLGGAMNDSWVQEILAREPHYTDPNTNPALWHLANLYLRDGVVVDVPAGASIAGPLALNLNCAGGAFYVAHTLVRLGANAALTIIEDHRGQGGYWKNILSHIVLEPGARLTHIRLQDDSVESVYTQTTAVRAARDSTYNAINLATGAGLSRNQIHVALAESGAGCHLSGVALLRAAQHADTTILVEHKAAHCESKQNMRTVLDDRAHGVFQGKILVHQPAQKTDGYQLSRALVLSEGAEMDTKPELEIYADDVKCSHGATTGQLDEEPLFYMQSRGIGRDEARALLVRSFVAEGFAMVAETPAQEILEGRVAQWLEN